jgi:hypothetical protein
MIYSTIEKMRQQYPEIILVRHEDFALDPLGCFSSSFQV